ncbi:putative isomerase YbhE [Mucidula mucida]|nr:putative isomerase YbhE [Mucidula mucida]
MVNFTILAGGYDLFIATYLFNSAASTLSLAGKYPTGANSSWITLHPTNGSVLYAVNQNNDDAVQSFSVTPEGVLSEAVVTVSSGGLRPAHAAALTSGQLAVVNYSGGNARIIPTTDSPLNLDVSDSGIITFPSPEGGVSHPHMAYQYKNEVFVPDLGSDTVWRLVEDGSPGNWKIAGSIDQPKGSGPRHIVVYDELLYTLHELSSTLTVQAIPTLGATNTSALLANVSIVPSDPPEGAAYAAGEILIPPPSQEFPIPYVYVSNRNTGTTLPRGDSIAIFEYCEGELKLVNQVYTGINQIRGMEFGGEHGDYLVMSGVVGEGGVAVFKRIEGGKNMVEVARNTEVLTRTTFVWL